MVIFVCWESYSIKASNRSANASRSKRLANAATSDLALQASVEDLRIVLLVGPLSLLRAVPIVGNRLPHAFFDSSLVIGAQAL